MYGYIIPLNGSETCPRKGMRGCGERERSDFEVLATSPDDPFLKGRRSGSVRPRRGSAGPQDIQTRVITPSTGMRARSKRTEGQPHEKTPAA